ncbi:MAG: glycosyltransferase family 2 protein [Planctomycetes bacterium]|nr:glycosyltransferase family 2 protein [Planctomycetota bacterium]
MKNPLVSVIIPTYNRSHVICKAIESVLQQTYQNIELIVVDDGSTDDTPSRLAVYGQRVRVLRQDNSGPSVARNRGVETSHGEILAFLDSDDLWLPTKIEQQVHVLENVDNSVPCCLCNALIRGNPANKPTSFALAPLQAMYDKGIWLNVTSVLSTRCVFFIQAVAIRRSSFEKIGGFDESLWVMEDHDLALRLSLEGPWAYIKEPLVIYNKGAFGSLADQARRDPVQLQQCIKAIHMKILSDNRIKDRKTQRNMRCTIRTSKAKTQIARMSQSSFPGTSVLSTILDTILKFKAAIFRRSPWFPKMEQIPFEI